MLGYLQHHHARQHSHCHHPMAQCRDATSLNDLHEYGSTDIDKNPSGLTQGTPAFDFARRGQTFKFIGQAFCRRRLQ